MTYLSDSSCKVLKSRLPHSLLRQRYETKRLPSAGRQLRFATPTACGTEFFMEEYTRASAERVLENML